MDVTGFQVELLSKLLDVAALRHNVLAQNVANANTAGYRQLDVTFEENLGRALNAGAKPGALRVEPQVVQGKGGLERRDGNNVDMDAEMGRLNKNTTLYKTYTQILAVQLAQLRSAISGQ